MQEAFSLLGGLLQGAQTWRFQVSRQRGTPNFTPRSRLRQGLFYALNGDTERIYCLDFRITPIQGADPMTSDDLMRKP